MLVKYHRMDAQINKYRHKSFVIRRNITYIASRPNETEKTHVNKGFKYKIILFCLGIIGIKIFGETYTSLAQDRTSIRTRTSP